MSTSPKTKEIVSNVNVATAPAPAPAPETAALTSAKPMDVAHGALKKALSLSDKNANAVLSFTKQLEDSRSQYNQAVKDPTMGSFFQAQDKTRAGSGFGVFVKLDKAGLKAWAGKDKHRIAKMEALVIHVNFLTSARIAFLSCGISQDMIPNLAMSE